MIKIKSLEIESPYRYRGYEVGKPVMYDIQNDAYIQDDTAAIVKSIDKCNIYECGQPTGRSCYSIAFDNDEVITILDNQAGLILTTLVNK